MKYQKIQYCIAENNKVIENTIRWGKTSCIDDFIKTSLFFTTWKDAYNLGVRCIKININITKIK